MRSAPVIGPVRAFTGDVLPFLTRCRVTYGDAFRLRMFNLEMTCLCGPDALALLQSDTCLRTSSSMHVLTPRCRAASPSMFDGPHHQMFRKAHHQFMNHSLESTRREGIQGWLDEHTARWQPGARVDVLHEAQTQTVDVLSHLLNGEPFPFKNGSWRRSSTPHLVHVRPCSEVDPAQPVVPVCPEAHALAPAEARRRDPRQPRTGCRNAGGALPRPPGPARTGGWVNEDLVAVPYGAYLAGFDTVASAASFLVYRLLSNPDSLAQVRAEYEELARGATGPVDPAQQRYLRAAFVETVRLNPPGSAVLRFAERDFEFAGHTIRKDDEILVVIASDHLDEEYFPNPTDFDPGRFLGDGSADLKRRVLPFGSGAHRCTGAALGELIAVEMVSHWINRFDLRIEPSRAGIQVTARPYTQPKGLRVRVVGRRVALTDR
ncbi:MAG: cytochrome P450 [Actinobacteria bacterium]|nr:cytochrome P450 [Actinomycetota bacterium]